MNFTTSEPGLDDFLSLPVPRDGAERFMTHARRRMRATAKVFVGLFGAVGVLILVLALFSLRDASSAGAVLGVVAASFVGLVLLVGAPTWLYLRQDVTAGLRLLQRGAVEVATVAGVGTTPHGVAVVTVAWSHRGRPVESTFRLPSAPPDLASLVGSRVQLLHLEGALGLWQPGQGLVTTR